MSMITEQVNQLRDYADMAEISDDVSMKMCAKAMKEAAETIEQLAAKVRKENGFIFPDNPTNGDMIKALFSETAEITGEFGVFFEDRWWNAPYKRGKTE